MDRAPVDTDKILALHAEGLSQTEIAKRLDIAPSTLRARLKKLGLARSPLTPPPVSSFTAMPQAIPQTTDVRLLPLVSDLEELCLWWQERKAVLEHASDGSHIRERVTFHVERRWVAAIRRRSDLDRLSLTQVVNEAFRHYFERK